MSLQIEMTVERTISWVARISCTKTRNMYIWIWVGNLLRRTRRKWWAHIKINFKHRDFWGSGIDVIRERAGIRSQQT